MILTLVGNKICIELSEPETYAIDQKQNIQATFPLHPKIEQNFRYALNVEKEISKPELDFRNNELQVIMPLEIVKNWVLGSERILESTIHNALGEDFVIQLKKNF